MRIKTTPTALPSQINPQLMSETALFQQFLRQNWLKQHAESSDSSYDSPKQHKKRKNKSFVQISPQAMQHLRKKFNSQYQSYFKVLNKNIRDNKRFQQKHETQLAKQAVLKANKNKIYISKQEEAKHIKSNYLKKKSSIIHHQIKKWQSKVEMNHKKERVQLKKSNNKIRVWETKLEDSHHKKMQNLSRISSASKKHNERVESILSKKRELEQQQAQVSLLDHEQKERALRQRLRKNGSLANVSQFKSATNSVYSLSKSNSKQSLNNESRIQRSESNRKKYQALIQSESNTVLSRMIDKQKRIRESRSKRIQTTAEGIKAVEQKNKSIKDKVNQNIRNIMNKQRKINQQIERKLKQNPPPASHHTINYQNFISRFKTSHHCQQDISLPQMNLPKISKIYLTQAIPHSNCRYTSKSKPRPSVNRKHHSVHDMVNAYKKSIDRESPRDIDSKVLGNWRPRDLAEKYSGAIKDKLKEMGSRARLENIMDRQRRMKSNAIKQTYIGRI